MEVENWNLTKDNCSWSTSWEGNQGSIHLVHSQVTKSSIQKLSGQLAIQQTENVVYVQSQLLNQWCQSCKRKQTGIILILWHK